MEKKIAVYYDGVCNMCEKSMRTLESSSQGGKFQRLDVTKGVLPPHKNADEAMRNVHVVDTDGRVYEGVDGILRILDEYPQWRWLAKLGRVWGFHAVARGIYRFVASHRRRLNSVVSR